MARPSINIALSNGGLNLLAPGNYGTCGVVIATPAAPTAGYGNAFIIKNIAQAKLAFADAANATVLADITNYFFAEAKEGTTVYVLCMAQTTTLTTMAAAVNSEKLLSLASGDIRMMAYIKYPANTYNPTITNGFDADVHTAVTAGQTLANTWLGNKKPFRFFVHGFGFVSASAAKDYSATTNRNGMVVAAEINGSTAQATWLALGRATAIQPQQNIGRVKTLNKAGSLSLALADSDVVTIGGVSADTINVTDLETLWDKRYITIERNPVASGYVFNDDNTLTAVDDDYNNLRYGRVIDNVVRIAFTTYAKELKDDVDVDEGGRLSLVVEKALENEIEVAVNDNIAGQLSANTDGTAAITCLVNPDPAAYPALYLQNGIDTPNFNLLQTGTVYIFPRCRPKGCLKQIDVYVGFTA